MADDLNEHQARIDVGVRVYRTNAPAGMLAVSLRIGDERTDLGTVAVLPSGTGWRWDGDDPTREWPEALRDAVLDAIGSGVRAVHRARAEHARHVWHVLGVGRAEWFSVFAPNDAPGSAAAYYAAHPAAVVRGPFASENAAIHAAPEILAMRGAPDACTPYTHGPTTELLRRVAIPGAPAAPADATTHRKDGP